MTRRATVQADPLPPDALDRLVWPLLTTLRLCAAEQLGLVGRPVCHFPIVTGATHPPADRCDCSCAPPQGSQVKGQGEAWVRHVVARTVPRTTTTGRQLPAHACSSYQWQITVELGLYRCWPTLDSQHRAPDDATYDAHSHGLALDAAALRRAVACCNPVTANRIPYAIDQAGPITPAGGCAGTYLMATFTRDDHCACPKPGNPAPPTSP